MSVCSVQDLISTNPCLSELNPWALELVKTQILCNLKTYLESGGTVTCDIQTLLDDAQCFNTVAPATLAVLQVQLLCDISNLLTELLPE